MQQTLFAKTQLNYQKRKFCTIKLHKGVNFDG